jgi:Cys-tRNA(Pro)/Cys-tRNA(Cys) deacylase
MSRATRATEHLTRAGVDFAVFEYEYDPSAGRSGIHAAEALRAPPERVLKTLMLRVDRKPACAIVPSSSEAALKKVASAFGGKSAEMMAPADAERISGYSVGGISPFGLRRTLPTAIDETALLHGWVFLNAGRRGLQVRLSPQQAVRVLGAIVAPLAAGASSG